MQPKTSRIPFESTCRLQCISRSYIQPRLWSCHSGEVLADGEASSLFLQRGRSSYGGLWLLFILLCFHVCQAGPTRPVGVFITDGQFARRVHTFWSFWRRFECPQPALE